MLAADSRITKIWCVNKSKLFTACSNLGMVLDSGDMISTSLLFIYCSFMS